MLRLAALWIQYVNQLKSLFSVNFNKESIRYSIKSLQLAFKNWRRYIELSDIKSSREIARSSNFSGKAINIAKTNGPHVSYYFSTYHNLSHGHAVTLTINSFLLF